MKGNELYVFSDLKGRPLFSLTESNEIDFRPMISLAPDKLIELGLQWSVTLSRQADDCHHWIGHPLAQTLISRHKATRPGVSRLTLDYTHWRRKIWNRWWENPARRRCIVCPLTVPWTGSFFAYGDYGCRRSFKPGNSPKAFWFAGANAGSGRHGWWPPHETWIWPAETEILFRV